MEAGRNDHLSISLTHLMELLIGEFHILIMKIVLFDEFESLINQEKCWLF